MTQKKAKTKKFNLKSLEKQYKSINTYSTHELKVNGKTETIRYYRIFDIQKIDKLLEEAATNLKHDKDNEIGFFTEDGRLFHYLLFLTIRYFTELYDSIPATLEEQIPIFHQFKGTGLYEEMINNMFDPNETGKVIERFTEFISLTQKLTDMENQIRQDAIDKVQHPLLKKKLQEGKIDA